MLFKLVRNRTATAVVLKETHLLSLTKPAWEKVSKILKSTTGALKGEKLLFDPFGFVEIAV